MVQVYVSSDTFGLPLFDYVRDPPSIFEMIADKSKQWRRLAPDPYTNKWGFRYGWTVDGYGTPSNEKEAIEMYFKYKRLHWITLHGNVTADGVNYKFSSRQEAVDHVREVAMITGDPIYVLAIELHDLNDILTKAQSIR